MLLEPVEDRYASQQHEQQHGERRNHQQGRRLQPKLLDEWREYQRRHGLADRTARDVGGHGHAALGSRESVYERGGWGMERRPTETADHEHQRQCHRIGCESDARDGRDAQDRSRAEEQTRSPPVRDMTESKLGD